MSKIVHTPMDAIYFSIDLLLSSEYFQSTKNQELLRNALERASAEKTAKQLLCKELSDTTATRDKLMKDLNNVKKVRFLLGVFVWKMFLNAYQQLLQS